MKSKKTNLMNKTHCVLKNKILDIISPCLPDGMDNICIIDPPFLPNVGDCAILAGELDFFRRYYPSAHISYFSKTHFIDAHFKYIENASLLAFHGGGNFGNIWPTLHESRLFIMDKYPDIPKIQFPQSIFFDDIEDNNLLQRTQRSISQQKNYKLFVRDKPSFEFAKNHFDCETYLCPDMAFSLRPLKRHQPNLDYFCLLRTDKEKLVEKSSIIANALTEHSLSYKINDWIERDKSFAGRLDRTVWRITCHIPPIIQYTPKLSLWTREQFAWARIYRGINLLSSGERVVTDRLHGHIIATLLGIPHFIFDSFDGKISAFHSTWLSENRDVKFVESIEEFSDLDLPPENQAI